LQTPELETTEDKKKLCCLHAVCLQRTFTKTTCIFVKIPEAQKNNRKAVVVCACCFIATNIEHHRRYEKVFVKIIKF